MLSAKEEDMRACLRVLDERFGGAEAYIERYCDMTKQDVAKIKGNLIVEEAPVL
ncbi:hypothetical protein EV356DRAFT_499178 [Viridothelium virens]|uniref:Uncharacterized protein n=1 Tax=Viridothelium virens TaxID=1048519 RepID=A0A6A6HEL9_VIRVR|nr:hypothetical protein EV356DRAFT_499178 [Viridothelium virens]